MTSSYPLRTLVLAAASAMLLGTGAQAGPIPTHLSTMKAMVDQATTEVRWVGGWRGGYGYRGLGYGVAGAVVGGAIARSAYYGSYGGYYGGYYGGDPGYGYGYGYPAASYGYGGGYGYGGEYCPPTGSYWAY